MSRIRVNTNVLEQQQAQMERVVKTLRSVSADVSYVKRNLGWNISSRSQIKSTLTKYSDYVDLLQAKTRNLSDRLQSAATQYQNVEKKASPPVSAFAIGSLILPINRPDWKLLGPGSWKPPFGIGLVVPGFSTVLPMLISPALCLIKRDFFGGEASSDVLGGKLDWSAKSSWDKEEGEVGAAVEGEASGYLWQGKASGHAGIASGSVETQIGAGAVTGEAGITLFKDGKLSPEIGAKVSAEVEAAKGKVEGKLGTEDYNAHASADGSLLKAKAEASAGAGKITYKDESGNTKTGYGAEAKAGAEAYVAEGKVSGGFTLGGVKVDISLSGKAGGAGASAGGRITTGGASGEIGLGLGLGAGVKIDIDWSGLFKGKKWW